MPEQPAAMSAPATPSRTLSEAESKSMLAAFGVPFPPEAQATSAGDAVKAAAALGHPVVVKLNGPGIAHKTERGLVRLRLGDSSAVETAARDLLSAATPDDGDVSLLVAPMVSGTRELIAGISIDPHFGPTVMVGVGGVLAEALDDVVVRLAPIDRVEAREMLSDLRTQRLFGAFRGEPAVDLDALVELLVGLSTLPAAHSEVVSVDLNPLIVGATDGRPIAVDALVEVRR